MAEQLWSIINRLPWEKTSRGRTPLVMEEARELVLPAMVAAVRQYELSLELVIQHSLTSLAKAGRNPVKYLVGAFEAENLPLAPPEDVLEMPTTDTTQQEASPRAPQRSAPVEPEAEPEQSSQPASADAIEQVLAEVMSPAKRRRRRSGPHLVRESA